MKTKICGITTLSDAKLCVELGASAIGFIFYSKSPRFVSPTSATSIVQEVNRPGLETVGVFVNESVETILSTIQLTKITTIQLHGNETPQFCQEILQKTPKIKIIKAIRLKSESEIDLCRKYENCCDYLLLDTFQENVLGGTGILNDLQLINKVKTKLPLILSGGLTPENILPAINSTQPSMVDVNSGVELSPGKKDPEKLKKLFTILSGIL